MKKNNFFIPLILALLLLPKSAFSGTTIDGAAVETTNILNADQINMNPQEETPTTYSEGSLYWDAISHTFKGYDGASWQNFNMGTLTLDPWTGTNQETMDNLTDGYITFQGVGGTSNNTLKLKLDNPNDVTIESQKDLILSSPDEIRFFKGGVEQTNITNIKNAINNQHIQGTDNILQVNIPPGEVSDQENSNSSGGSDFCTDTYMFAQTFQCGESGTLSTLNITVNKGPSGSPNLIAEIRTVSSGFPTDVVLATETVLYDDLPDIKEEISIGFTIPASVVAGTNYAIVLKSSDSNGIEVWYSPDETAYPLGQGLYKDAVNPWGLWGADWQFLTYVTPTYYGQAPLIDNGILKRDLQVAGNWINLGYVTYSEYSDLIAKKHDGDVQNQAISHKVNNTGDLTMTGNYMVTGPNATKVRIQSNPPDSNYGYFDVNAELPRDSQTNYRTMQKIQATIPSGSNSVGRLTGSVLSLADFTAGAGPNTELVGQWISVRNLNTAEHGGKYWGIKAEVRDSSTAYNSFPFLVGGEFRVNRENVKGSSIAVFAEVSGGAGPDPIIAVKAKANPAGAYSLFGEAGKIWNAGEIGIGGTYGSPNAQISSSGEMKIKVYSQTNEPTLSANSFCAFWIDTDDSSKVYLLFRRGAGDQVKVELL